MLIAVGMVWFVISLMRLPQRGRLGAWRLQLKSAFDIRYRVGFYLPCRLFSATTTNLMDCPHVAFPNAVVCITMKWQHADSDAMEESAMVLLAMVQQLFFH